MPDAPAVLKKKVAGLPVGIWVVLVVGAVAVGLYIRKRNADAAAAAGTDQSADPNAPVDASSLPSDFGGYPLTGGGVPGGGDGIPQSGTYPQAIQLNPGTLRIILRQPRPHKKRPPKKVLHRMAPAPRVM